jgi:4-amino-4-deoxychorismate lyase
VADRGLQFGDGVFETMLCHAGAPLDFDAHWARLRHGCDRLGFACPDVRPAVIEAVRRHADRRAVAKLIVTRGCSQRGYRAAVDPVANWILTLSEAPKVDPRIYETGVAVTVCRTRLAREDDRLVGLKHLNRLTQVLARSEWADEFHDGLLLDHGGAVVEGSASNVFTVTKGALVTPDLATGGVNGIVRRRVLAHARATDLSVQERTLTRAELESADEVFLTNSVYGVVPVRSIGFTRYPVGAVARRMLDAIDPGHHFSTIHGSAG